jgi:hypothetical protein
MTHPPRRPIGIRALPVRARFIVGRRQANGSECGRTRSDRAKVAPSDYCTINDHTKNHVKNLCMTINCTRSTKGISNVMSDSQAG